MVIKKVENKLKLVGLKWVGNYRSYEGCVLKEHPALLFEDDDNYIVINFSSLNQKLRDVMRDSKNKELRIKIERKGHDAKLVNVIVTTAIIPKEKMIVDIVGNTFKVIEPDKFIKSMANAIFSNFRQLFFYNGDATSYYSVVDNLPKNFNAENLKRTLKDLL